MAHTLAHILGRLVAIAGAVAIVVAGTLGAPPAFAADDDVCDGPDRYLLLVDPTGVANQALCRTQERVLKELSETQWGVEYTSEQRARMLRWGRGEALAAMYIELLRVAGEPAADRDPDEQAVYGWLQTTLGALRARLANGAYAEYLEWHADPCGYVNPMPGATAAGCDPDSLVTLFGPPPGPSYEEFVSYGVQRVLGEELGDSQIAVAAAAARAVKNQLVGAAVGTAIGLPFSGALVSSLLMGMTYSAASGVATIAGTAAASVVAAAAASIVFVVIAVVTAVVRGVQVFEQDKIDDQLLADIGTADDPVAVSSWLGDDSTRALVLLYALTSRLNGATPPAAAAPGSPAADAPGFLVQTGADDTTYTQTIRFRSPVTDDAYFSAWLDDGWWVIRDDDGGRAMSHDLVYLDHDHLTRSAALGADGAFLVTTPSVTQASATCDATTLCEQAEMLRILTPPSGDTDPLHATARLLGAPIEFTLLPDLETSYAVGDHLTGAVTARASYLTTMGYRWELTRQATPYDQTATMSGDQLDRILTLPGDYRLTVVATASSGEVARHSWDFTVAGDAEGQLYSGIQVTQYPADSADGSPPGEPGPWLEGSTEGTICVSTGSTDPTDFAVTFPGEDEVAAQDVTVGYACFPRPASAQTAGVHLLELVSACLDGQLCIPPTTIDPEIGRSMSPFSYTVDDVAPVLDDVRQGLAGGPLAVADPPHPAAFDRGDTIEARTVVTDPGGGPLTVLVRWSDGAGQTLTGLESGDEIVVTHTYPRSKWGPVGVQFQAFDAAGEGSNLATGFFDVRPAPVTVDAAATARADGLATLTGSYAEDEDTATFLGIDWGDGSHDLFPRPFPAPLDTALSGVDDLLGRFGTSHRYATAGNHTVTATVYNGAPAEGTGTALVTIPAAAPVVRSDGAITVSGDGDAAFDAVLGDVTPGDALTLRVAYGDGQTDESAGHAPGDTVGVAHRYDDPGRYDAVLVAVDGDGLQSEPVTRCIVVGHDLASLPCPDAVPASDDALHGMPEGDASGPPEAHAGDTIDVSAGAGSVGHGIAAYIYSTPAALGTFVAGAGGLGSLQIPAGIAPGPHSIALFDGGALIGWFRIRILPASSTASGVLGLTGSDPRAALVTALLLMATGVALTASRRRRPTCSRPSPSR
jgi:hypothetical protein